MEESLDETCKSRDTDQGCVCVWGVISLIRIGESLENIYRERGKKFVCKKRKSRRFKGERGRRLTRRGEGREGDTRVREGEGKKMSRKEG